MTLRQRWIKSLAFPRCRFERLLADAGSNDWFELIQNIMLEAALYPALSHDLQTRDETHPYP